jgi:hypothetical protein
MSLNRYEQALFDYWQRQPDERRHWQARVAEIMRAPSAGGGSARELELELWSYFVERSRQVPGLQAMQVDGVRRVSLLNLAEYLLRVWGPPSKPKPTTGL